MKKFTFEIHCEDYCLHFTVQAATRELAIAEGEANWLRDMDWENELVGEMNEDGTPFKRTPVPEFTAKRVR